MKSVLKLTFLLIFSYSSFSQNDGKEKLNLVFYDNCSNKIIEPEFEIESLPEINYKAITIFVNRGNLIGEYSIILEKKKDTIRIPKILFSFGNELHSKRWNYMNCEKVCDGTETDFNSNGNKRFEGIFKNGKPIEIINYRQNGELLTQTFYENLTLNYKRVNYFNENGELTYYEIYKNKKRKTTIKTFDKKGKLINRTIEKKHIEKTKWN
ncbi:hypothetical protein H9W90_10395 [Polaribacter pectinis]|uniref:Antitoxin component YwqK of the YwqJK toxin-antitoxin module n=2 Tax=Polaribacter pectinis TaxID=2738844 RepID=A0A7G9LEQ3_9FLAO|nr:hypothetical protein H9W90_10395 [Polaribacter pectinis]